MKSRFIIDRKKLNTNILGQILIIISVTLAFLTAACVDKRQDFSQYWLQMLIIVLLDIACMGGWIGYARNMPSGDEKWTTYLQNIIVKNKWLLFVLLYTALIRLPQFGELSKYDGAIYYQQLIAACNNFNFTISQYLRDFSVVSHPTWGYLSILGIGEFLATGKVIGMQVANLLLTLVCVFCLYRLLQSILPSRSDKSVGLAVCVLSSLPLFAGIFFYMNPDMGVALFGIMMIYCYVFRKNILMFFCALLVVTSKETGTMLIAGFTVGIFLWIVLKGKGGLFNRIRCAFQEPLCIGMAIIGVVGSVGLGLYLVSGGSIWMYRPHNKLEFSTITFIPDFFMNNIKQFFILNFNWISTLLAIVSLIYCYVKKRYHVFGTRIVRGDLLVGVLAGYLFSVMFFCLFITFTLPRYHIIIDILWNFVVVVVILVCIDKTIVTNIILGGFTALLLVQSYVTIDPLTVKAFTKHDTGNGVAVTTQHRREGLETISGGDYGSYNHQFNYFEAAIEQVLRNVEYHEDMDVICYNAGEIGESTIYWDTAKKKRTYCASENTITLNLVNEVAVAEDAMHDRAVFLYFGQHGSDLEAQMNHMKWYYSFNSYGEINIPFGGVVEYWICDRLPE